MSRHRNKLLLTVVLLLALVGGAGTWLLERWDGGSAEGVQGTGQAAEAASEREMSDPRERLSTELGVPDESSEDGKTTVIWPLEVELTHVARAAFTENGKALEAVGSGASAGLSGTIAGAKGEGMRASLLFTAGPNEGRELHCDSSGRYGANDLYPGISIVRIESPQGHLSEREVRLTGGRSSLLNVGYGMPTSVYGSVTDAKANPIPGATVTLDGHETVTDDLGEFYFTKLASGTALATVHKPGFARYRETVPLPAGRTILKDNLTFRLEPGADLEISIPDVVGGPGPALVYLLPGTGQRTNKVLGQRTYPWHLVNPVEIYPGSPVVVEDLPEGSLHITAFRPGALANPKVTRSARMFAKRSNMQVLRLEPSPEVRGKVLRDGKPVKDVLVELEAPNRSAATYRTLSKDANYLQTLVLPQLPAALQRVRTNAAGKFRFTDYGEATGGYYVTAETRDGKWQASRVISPDEKDVELVLEPARDETVALEIVLSSRFQGLPIELRVNGEPRDPFELAPEEPLVVDGLERGTWRLSVAWHGSELAEKHPVELPGELQRETKTHRIDLPQGAIDGQSLEERIRAGVAPRKTP